MKFDCEEVPDVKELRLSCQVKDDAGNYKEVARAFVCVLHNALHKEPFALLEDVYVDPKYQKKGFGSLIVKKAIEKAEEKGCYKIIATFRHSKPHLKKFYEKFGFSDHGLEFRLDFKTLEI